MPTIAIVGAGPGLGLSLAKIFGRHGFTVALIARNKDRLDGLVTELTASGITAAAFPADTTNPAQLTAALQDAAARLGRIDVLEFSPHAGLAMVQPEDVTLDALRPQVDALLYGAVAAVQAVLPAMREAGSGTLLLTTGGGAIDPYPMLATANIAQAYQRNWALNLHKTLAADGIYAANIAINLMIADQAPKASRTAPRTTSPRTTGSSTPTATGPSTSSAPEPAALRSQAADPPPTHPSRSIMKTLLIMRRQQRHRPAGRPHHPRPRPPRCPARPQPDQRRGRPRRLRRRRRASIVPRHRPLHPRRRPRRGPPGARHPRPP